MRSGVRSLLLGRMSSQIRREVAQHFRVDEVKLKADPAVAGYAKDHDDSYHWISYSEGIFVGYNLIDRRSDTLIGTYRDAKYAWRQAKRRFKREQKKIEKLLLT